MFKRFPEIINTTIIAGILAISVGCVPEKAPDIASETQTPSTDEQSTEETQFDEDYSSPVEESEDTISDTAEYSDELLSINTITPKVFHPVFKNLSVTKKLKNGGTKEIVHFNLGGVRRNFIVHIPSNLPIGKPAPVIYMLHGTSGDGEKFYNISRWVEKANQIGAIAVFPSALVYCFLEDDNMDGVFAPNEIKITSKWNEGNFDAGKRVLCNKDEHEQYLSENQISRIESFKLKNDVHFIDQTLAYLNVTGKPIDRSRLYVSGFSNGAGMSVRLSVERSDVFAAFAAHGGGRNVMEVAPVKPASVIMTMGNLDDRVLARTGDSPLEDENDLVSLPLDESLSEVDAVMATLGSNLSIHSLDSECYSTANEELQGVETFVIRFENSLVEADNFLSYRVLEGSGHIYPNGVNNRFVMANHLWDIFKHLKL